MFKKFLSKKIPILLVLLCVLAVVAGIISARKQKDYSPATAEIINIERAYNDSSERMETRLTVKYIVEGKEYEGLLNYGEGTFEVGQYVQILYRNDDPRQLAEAQRSLSSYVIGIVLLVGAVYWLRKNSEQFT